MSMEQRLQRAFEVADRVEPSDDLWSRILYSIEEDRQHRRRVVRTVGMVTVLCVALASATIASLRDGPWGNYVPWQRMELIELIALGVVAITFAPAIRRFGRGYASDLWISEPSIPRALLPLLDVAYALVLAGYVMLTTRFEPDIALTPAFAHQLREACERLGGELLLIGMLHAMTMMALPLVALVSNSNRHSRKLPRFAVALIVIGGPVLGLVMLQLLGFVIAVGSS